MSNIGQGAVDGRKRRQWVRGDEKEKKWKQVTRSTCNKEDIDKKKREAMARRQLLQSQARKWFELHVYDALLLNNTVDL